MSNKHAEEEELKASLLRQWKEGKLEVRSVEAKVRGRQIPTIEQQRAQTSRTSIAPAYTWPPGQPHALPDISIPPPCYPGPPPLPPQPPALPPLSREQVLQVLVGSPHLGPVVEALLGDRSSRRSSPLSRSKFLKEDESFRRKRSMSKNKRKSSPEFNTRERGRSCREHERDQERKLKLRRSESAAAMKSHRTRSEVKSRTRQEEPATERLQRIPDAKPKDYSDLLTGELFNMDRRKGKCGALAVVRQFIDNKSGLLEMRSSSVKGSVIFHREQVFVARGRFGGPALPLLNGADIKTALHLGQEVQVNVRRVTSGLVELQATVLWPTHYPPPLYRLPGLLEEQLARFHSHSKEEMVALSVHGLSARGSHRGWRAKVKKIIDDSWGIIEIKSSDQEGQQLLCVFHRSDIW